MGNSDDPTGDFYSLGHQGLRCNMIRGFQVDLAFYKSMQEWEPAVGDYLVHHGWFTHWFGVISQVNPDNTIELVKSGLPVLLLTMNNSKMEKSKTHLDVADIKSARGGKYAAVKCIQNSIVWHV